MSAPEETPSVPTIGDVLNRFRNGGGAEGAGHVDWAAVEAALLEREDQIVGMLHVAGSQFGLFPQIVAEVLAQVGLGTPRSEAERVMLRQQFLTLMEQVARAQRGEGPMPTP